MIHLSGSRSQNINIFLTMLVIFANAFMFLWLLKGMVKAYSIDNEGLCSRLAFCIRCPCHTKSSGTGDENENDDSACKSFENPMYMLSATTGSGALEMVPVRGN